ncbi:MAG TPA: 1,4-dihydroxy-2-naphthoate octaprenyltransferase [Flavobacterium sp.]|nr:1,4-dihydroxy-2-naphthoate octaprenyltransferase [Flavobacterium sp.]
MKHWIEAARPRTLPLSVSGILVGSFYAMSESIFNWKIVLLALATTLLLQILSNFANDYGDGIKGTDNDNRIGPKRAMQRGAISPESMRRALYITSFLTAVSALALIYVSFKETNYIWSLFYVLLGALAVASAIRYTVGNTAYGYRGYGDIFVFVFFGWVSTMGVSFMILKEIDTLLLLPATAIGLLSVGVLNLNNMRDEASDRLAGKNTLVVKIGGERAKTYHYFLVISAMVLFFLFGFLFDYYKDVNPGELNVDVFFFLIMYIPLIRHLGRVKRAKHPADLDPELRKLAVSTFLISVILSLSLIYFFSDIVVQVINATRNQL